MGVLYGVKDGKIVHRWVDGKPPACGNRQCDDCGPAGELVPILRREARTWKRGVAEEPPRWAFWVTLITAIAGVGSIFLSSLYLALKA